MDGEMGHFSHVSFAARTDVGKKRKNNEDAFGAFPSSGVYCVADGMGGGADGEIASAATIKAVEDAIGLLPVIEDGGFPAAKVAERAEVALGKASEWIWKRSKEKKLGGCGSTFVGVVLDATDPGKALAIHSGDSRLYLVHGKKIKQITRDHSVAELMGEKDENKVNPMFRSMVVNAVGIREKVDVERTSFKIATGDKILVCSDGLSKMVADKRIASIISGSETVEDASDALITAALEAGGIDNVTLVLCDIGELPSPLRPVEIPSQEALKTAADDAETDDGGSDSTKVLPQKPVMIARRVASEKSSRRQPRFQLTMTIGLVSLLALMLVFLAVAIFVNHRNSQPKVISVQEK